MNSLLFHFGEALILIVAFLFIYLIFKGFKYSFSLLYDETVVKKLLSQFLLICGCWILILSICVYFLEGINQLIFVTSIFIIPFAFLTIPLFTPFFKRILVVLPSRWPIQVQSIRLLNEMMLLLGFWWGFIPFYMTMAGFNYDSIIGITAIFAGYFFFSGGRYFSFQGILWNVSGLFMLLNILVLIVLSLPGVWQVFNTGLSETVFTQSLFVLIPGFILPLCAVMHLVSIKQILLKSGVKRN